MKELVYGVLSRAVPAVTPDHLRADAKLAEELGISSIGMIAIITELCDLLEVDIFQFTDQELVTLSTVGDLMTLFSGKMNAAS